MNVVLDDSLVGLVLLASATYAVASLGPRTLRVRILSGLGRAAARLPAAFGLGSTGRRITAAATAKTAGSCGGCDGCGSDGDRTVGGGATPTAGAPRANVPRANAPRSEVSVALAKISRRH
jgi:hypothetical protein